MSIALLIAADCPLPEAILSDCVLRAFPRIDLYSQRPYAVCLDWPGYTAQRAAPVLDYLRARLRETDRLELLKLWDDGYWEYDDRPILHRTVLPAAALTGEVLEQLDRAVVWDRKAPLRPIFTCIELRR